MSDRITHSTYRLCVYTSGGLAVLPAGESLIEATRAASQLHSLLSLRLDVAVDVESRNEQDRGAGYVTVFSLEAA